jgi:hypothetical protein
MPKHQQTKVEAVVSESKMGARSSANMSHLYAASPIHSGDMTDDSIKQQYQDIVLDGVINDEGHTFGTYDTDYADAPSYDEVETGGSGLPASAWVPNPNSPGPGSQNPADQAEPPDGYGETPGDQWGGGVGSQLSPKSSSEKSSAHTLGDYILGKSSKE